LGRYNQASLLFFFEKRSIIKKRGRPQVDLSTFGTANYDDKFLKPAWTPKSYKQEIQLRALEYDCDRLSLENQKWLTQLPAEFSCEFEGVPTELYHASPKSLYEITYPWASLDELDQLHKYDQTKLVLFGHIHHAFVRQCRGRLIVNCGSIGMSFDGDNRASYAIVDIAKRDIAIQLRRVEYDIDLAIQIARNQRMPDLDSFEYALRTARYPYDAAKELPVT
jgi:diadenosine tetraphosphatase ApaH/serine/threonine PP2A family protein phosphatase